MTEEIKGGQGTEVNFSKLQEILRKIANNEQLKGEEIVEHQKYLNWVKEQQALGQSVEIPAEEKKPIQNKWKLAGKEEQTKDVSIVMHAPLRRKQLATTFEKLGLDPMKINDKNYLPCTKFLDGSHAMVPDSLKKQGLELMLKEESLQPVVFCTSDATKEVKIDIVRQIFANKGVDPEIVDDRNYSIFFRFLSGLTQIHIQDKGFVRNSLESIVKGLEATPGLEPVKNLMPTTDDVEKFRNLLTTQYGLDSEIAGWINAENYSYIAHELESMADGMDKSKFTPEKLKAYQQAAIREAIFKYVSDDVANEYLSRHTESPLESVPDLSAPVKTPGEEAIGSIETLEGEAKKSTTGEISGLFEKLEGPKDVKAELNEPKRVNVGSEVLEGVLLKGGLDTGAYKKLSHDLAQAGSQAKDLDKSSGALKAVDMSDANQVNKVLMDLYGDLSKRVNHALTTLNELGGLVEDVRRARGVIDTFDEKLKDRDRNSDLLGALLCEVIESENLTGKENPMNVAERKPILKYFAKLLGTTPEKLAELAKVGGFIGAVDAITEDIGKYDKKLGELAQKKALEPNLAGYVTQSQLEEVIKRESAQYVTSEKLEQRLSKLPEHKVEGVSQGRFEELAKQAVKTVASNKVIDRLLKQEAKGLREAEKRKVRDYVDELLQDKVSKYVGQELKKLPAAVSEQELAGLVQRGVSSALSSDSFKSEVEKVIRQYVKPGISDEEKARLREEAVKAVENNVNTTLDKVVSEKVSAAVGRLPKPTLSKEELDNVLQYIKGNIPNIENLRGSMHDEYIAVSAFRRKMEEEARKQEERYNRELKGAVSAVNERRAGFEAELQKANVDLDAKINAAKIDLDGKLIEASKYVGLAKQHAKEVGSANISAKLGWKATALIGAGLAAATMATGAYLSGRVNPKDAQVRYLDDNDEPDIYHPGVGVMLNGRHFVPDSDWLREKAKDPSTFYPPGRAPQVPIRNPQVSRR